MKQVLLISLIGMMTTSANAQATFACKAGKTHFFSSTMVEDIEATSVATVCVFNTTSEKIVAKIPVKTFHFRDKLMEEHFNENYLETEKYPNSTLEGTIQEKIDFTKDGVNDVTISGVLDLHGVKKEITVKGKLTVKNKVPTNAISTFMVKLKDYDIKVPSAVGVNIAEEIKVDVNFDFVKYEKEK